MEEDWKNIHGTYYEVSNTGEVRNCKTLRILKPFSYEGYLRVYLYINKKKRQFRLHRLVAEAFIPNPENKPEVDHIDRDGLNNKLDNLRWVTKKENMKNRVYSKRHPKVSKKTIKKIIKMNNSGMSAEDIYNFFKKLI